MARSPDEYEEDLPPRRPARRPEAERRSRPDDADDEREDSRPARRPGPERRHRPRDEDEDYAPESRPRRRPPPPERARRRAEDDDDVDDDDEDYHDIRKRDLGETLVPTGNPKALLAYYCGIFGLIPLLGLILGPLALVFGIQGKAYANRRVRAGGGGHAVAGLILGPIDFLIGLGVGITLLVMKRKGLLDWY
jgi:hypothetical protein